MAELLVRTGEKIISKTDELGNIKSGNDYFFELSGYDQEQCLGKPHNILRHPDMPKLVFRLLWTKLHAKQKVNAFVKNRTKNGDYYWVYATVIPVLDRDGNVVNYHSIRKASNPDAISLITPLYEKLNELERVEGPDASKTHLKEFLDTTPMKFNDLMSRMQAQGSIA